jgi:hypothetical protein
MAMIYTAQYAKLLIFHFSSFQNSLKTSPGLGYRRIQKTFNKVGKLHKRSNIFHERKENCILREFQVQHPAILFYRIKKGSLAASFLYD